MNFERNYKKAIPVIAQQKPIKRIAKQPDQKVDDDKSDYYQVNLLLASK